MAGRKKKQKIGKANRSAEKSPELILSQAEEMLSDGRIVRAREGFRRLFKLDPEAYRERFVEVTLLAIDEAIGTGKVEQAGQWLSHLKNELCVPSKELKIAELKLSGSAGNKAAVAELAMLQLASNDEAERRSGADALVLARAPEAGAVSAAISHLCKHEWEEVGKVVEPIGRKSPFAHWRLFLRGCVGYYKNDEKLAEACFSRLPEGTVPARKAQAFGKWRSAAVESLSEGELKESCLLCGEPEMAEALKKSEDFWVKGKYLKAYETMRAAGGSPGFPSVEVSLAGQLTRLFQHAGMSLSYHERDQWYGFAAKSMKSRRFNTPIDDYVLTSSLIHGPKYDPDTIWEKFRKSRTAVCGESARFHAMCHYSRALREFDLDCPCEECMEMANGNAFSILEKSIKADPSYEPAYKRLLSVYKDLDLKPDRNKLLDRMVKNFPNSETALIEAGTACLERNVYVKGIAYLEKARVISPLNGEITAMIRQGLEQKAVGHYVKGSAAQWQKARDCFDLLLKDVATQQQSGIDLRSIYLLQWSVLEGLAVDKRVSKTSEIADQVEGMEPHVAEFIYKVYWAEHAQKFDRRPDKPVGTSKTRGEKTPNQALQMLRFLLEIYEPSLSGGLRTMVTKLLEDYMDKSLIKLKAPDREIAVELYKLLDSRAHFWDHYPKKLVIRWLKLDKEDPLFVVCKWKDDEKEPTAKQITKVRETAEGRGDQLALKALDEYLEYIDDEGEYGNDFDPENYYEDDVEDEHGALETLKQMKPAERVRFLTSQGMPKAAAQSISDTIDMMQESAHFDDDNPIDVRPKKVKEPKMELPKVKVIASKTKPDLRDIDQQEFLF